MSEGYKTPGDVNSSKSKERPLGQKLTKKNQTLRENKTRADDKHKKDENAKDRSSSGSKVKKHKTTTTTTTTLPLLECLQSLTDSKPKVLPHSTTQPQKQIANEDQLLLNALKSEVGKHQTDLVTLLTLFDVREQEFQLILQENKILRDGFTSLKESNAAKMSELEDKNVELESSKRNEVEKLEAENDEHVKEISNLKEKIKILKAEIQGMFEECQCDHREVRKSTSIPLPVKPEILSKVKTEKLETKFEAPECLPSGQEANCFNDSGLEMSPLIYPHLSEETSKWTNSIAEPKTLQDPCSSCCCISKHVDVFERANRHRAKDDSNHWADVTINLLIANGGLADEEKVEKWKKQGLSRVAILRRLASLLKNRTELAQERFHDLKMKLDGMKQEKFEAAYSKALIDHQGSKASGQATSSEDANSFIATTGMYMKDFKAMLTLAHSLSHNLGKVFNQDPSKPDDDGPSKKRKLESDQ